MSKSVVIVGAGISGLSCALHLLKGDSEIKVTIVEGRERNGGRIFTYEKKNDDLEIVADLGASWIHGWKGNPITKLAQKYGFKVISREGKCLFFDETGKKLNNKVWPLEEKIDDFLEEIEDETATPENDISIRQVLNKKGKEWLDALFQKRKKLFGGERKTFDAFVETVIAGYELFNGAPLENLTCREDAFDSSFGGDKFFPRYSRIIHKLVEEIKETKRGEILNSHIVNEIKYDENSKKIQVLGINADKKEFTITGDYCVVTVSLGVLKSDKIQFTPPLPDSKRDCIKRMGFGTVNKIVLGFKKSFWPEDVKYIGYANSLGEFPWFLNLSFEACIKDPILVCFFGRGTKEMEELEESEIIKRALTVLSKHFGEKVFDLFSHGVATKWGSDPFSLGSYSYFSVGQTLQDYDTLVNPCCDNRLMFAGEATIASDYGCAHSGYLSGQREAERILKSKKKTKVENK